VLDSCANDTRVVSTLWRHDPSAIVSLAQRLPGSHNLWPAIVVLNHTKADAGSMRFWPGLRRSPLPALSALTLSSEVEENCKIDGSPVGSEN
jgi:hypothetical protein